MDPYNFGPAAHDEKIVFGAGRPGLIKWAHWMEFMWKSIRRVCLL
jgi:hypothetical protein